MNTLTIKTHTKKWIKIWIPLISKNLKKLLKRHKSIFTDNDIKDLNEADYNTKTF